MALDKTNSYIQDLVAKSIGTDADEKAFAIDKLRNLESEDYNRSNSGMGSAALGDFKTLLGRLESSKIRQQQAKDVSARPNIYAGGLANMMANF